MKARLLGGIAALVVAIIGTVMLVLYVQGADKRALANTETEEVYIVQKDIPAGTTAAKFETPSSRGQSQSQPSPRTASTVCPTSVPRSRQWSSCEANKFSPRAWWNRTPWLDRGGLNCRRVSRK